MDPVFFRILGPLRAGVQDRTVELDDDRARLVLAALLLEALEGNGPVAADRLVQAVWGGERPASARTQVAIAVSGLRRAFRHAGYGHTVIETVPPGYRIAAGTIDARIAERHIARARAAGTAGRYAEASKHYRDALSLWHGPVLEGLQSSLVVAGALRWERLQLAVTEEAAEVELALGRHHALVGELQGWVSQYPFHERLRSLLMTALMRAGRHREALEVYSDGRRVLREGLDLDPGRELQSLYESILLDGAWRQGEPPSASGSPPGVRPPGAWPPDMPEPPAAKSSRAGRAPRAMPSGRYCAGAVPRTNRWRGSRGPRRPYGSSGEHPGGR
ncbi:BTAD domain-containing putative transcriptional regulator [Actinomadura sp. NBRC 104412]|uniref:AfsR/SARP family transcriptional regulator n=1 Tax=Actinomadura sp. NBRC 104412 TaxID=3032203 RepID=UPI0025548A9B|nr:BTAD domain-containing putative transcriptional regulator [Actinomadura sp. NBRC 104412]